MRKLSIIAIAAALFGTPAVAAGGPFLSLGNTDFVVLLGFITFILILVYYKVPGMLAGLLDQRAEGIRSDLDEARALREEAQALLASYERKSREVQDQAAQIVVHAKEEAAAAATKAHEDLQASIARRLSAAEEQILSAQAAAVTEVRNRAVTVAITAARSVIAGQMNASTANALIDASIKEVGQKLH
jgi:F-type H+-transporting ATPase subunit b